MRRFLSEFVGYVRSLLARTEFLLGKQIIQHRDGKGNNNMIYDSNNEIHRIEKVIEDEGAETYDSIYARLAFYEYRNQVFAKLIASLTTDTGFARILEIGCGTGNLTRRIEGCVGKKSIIVGLDLSRKMIDVAKEKVKITNLVIALGEKLPFAGNSFDLIVGGGILHHIPDLDSFFKEISRVAKTKGKIVFYEPYEGGILDISLFRKAVKALLLPVIILLWRLNKEKIRSLPTQKFSPAHRHLTKQEIANSLPGWHLCFTHTDVVTPLFEGITFDTDFDWALCNVVNMLDRILRMFMKGGGIIVKGVRI